MEGLGLELKCTEEQIIEGNIVEEVVFDQLMDHPQRALEEEVEFEHCQE
jgi:hypothetical protein